MSEDRAGASPIEALRASAIAIGASSEDVGSITDEPTLFGAMVDAIMFRSGLDVSFAEAVERAGVNPRFARRVWLALGNPDPDDSQPRVSMHDIEVLRFIDSAQSLLGADDAVRVAASIGASTSRLAVTVVSALEFSLDWPRASTQTPRAELATFFKGFADELMPMLIDTFDTSLRRQIAALVPFDWPSWDSGLPEAEMVVGALRFTRLAGVDPSTAVDRLPGALTSLLAPGGGRFVRFLADGALLVHPDREEAASIGRRIISLPEMRGIDPCLGLTFGPVAVRRGEVAGPAVSTAMRLARRARAGETVATPGVAEGATNDWEPTSEKVFVGVDGDARIYRLT